MDKYKVVIVDDDDVALENLSFELWKDARFSLEGTARNGRKGKKLIMKVQPDLLFLDVEMPDMTGLELLQEIRDYVSWNMRVELYSFQITCGAVLMYNGLSGLLKGFFMKVDEHIKIADLTTVPIAIPMIAGPATITAAVTFPVQYSRFVTIVAILLALAVNLFFMLKARRIGSFLIKYNFMNPLIRIIGLIVATIGLQMVFDGITLFIKTLA